MHHLDYAEASVIGLLQGVTELFPISSLGHSVLIPAWIGGTWAKDLNVSTPESPYLAFIVGLHVATAIALIIFFRKDWLRIIKGLFTSLRDRSIESPDQRLAWLLIVATIPVGLVGLALEHTFRTTFGKPSWAAVFLTVNGIVLFLGEKLRKRSVEATDVEGSSDVVVTDTHIARQSFGQATLIGSAEIFALLAGISRSGATMVAGLLRGLSHEDAARFSFLLATPVILAAGVLKVPDLTGSLGAGIRGQVIVGSILSGVGAYISVKFLTKYFETRTLTPFAIYCLVFGAASIVRFTL
jgi:undecaprenyl-diphosphatase